MHIPDGYKLVPVDLLERVVCLDNSFRRHRQAQHDLVTFLAAPVPPKVEVQPVAWRNVATGHVTTSAVVEMDWDDEKEQVQSLFTHSDAGEVERTPAQRDAYFESSEATMRGLRRNLASAEQERDTLRAQLAELKSLSESAVNDWCDAAELGDMHSSITALEGHLSATKEGKGDEA